MSIAVDIIVFIICLAIMLGASEVLVRGIDHLSTRLHLSGGMVGLLTALGADSPEISSALVAVFTGVGNVGVGVIFGSNIFNLATLLGVSAIIATRLTVSSNLVKLHGGVAMLITLIVAAGTLHYVPPQVMSIMLVMIVAPYIAVLAMRPSTARALPAPIDGLLRPLIECTEVETEAEQDDRARGKDAEAWPVWRLILQLTLPLLIIAGGSIGLVNTTLALATAWSLPLGLVGVLILAGLTGLPNAYAAIRLALQGQSRAVVSEALNSNTVNLVVGVGLPAALIGLGNTGPYVPLELGWLVCMTTLVLLLLGRKGGLTRLEGSFVVVLYVTFVAARILVPRFG